MEIIIRIVHKFSSLKRNFYYRCLGVKLDGYVWIRKIEIPRNHAEIEIGRNCALDRGVTLICSGAASDVPKIKISANTYINRNTIIDAIALIKIGRDCAIGPNCYLTDHDHGLKLGLSPLQQPMIARQTIIGDRVWLGANVTILKGVNIGNDVSIGAGSVVTKDIISGAIAVGVPAKVLRMKELEDYEVPQPIE